MIAPFQFKTACAATPLGHGDSDKAEQPAGVSARNSLSKLSQRSSGEYYLYVHRRNAHVLPVPGYHCPFRHRHTSDLKLFHIHFSHRRFRLQQVITSHLYSSHPSWRLEYSRNNESPALPRGTTTPGRCQQAAAVVLRPRQVMPISFAARIPEFDARFGRRNCQTDKKPLDTFLPNIFVRACLCADTFDSAGQ
jgi:hypothetical protein